MKTSQSFYIMSDGNEDGGYQRLNTVFILRNALKILL